jgi:hypothetical protein
MAALCPWKKASWDSWAPFKIPGVRTENNPPGLAWNMSPVLVELKLGATPVSQKQYFIPHKAQVVRTLYLAYRQLTQAPQSMTA